METITNQQILEAVNFLESNDCEVKIWDFPTTFDIWSKINNKYIAKNLNAYQFVQFYNRHKNSNN
jgi:hypothetical protein